MSEVCVVGAGVKICVAEGLATVVGLVSGDDIIIPSSAFFPPLAASLRVTRIDPRSFERQPITLITIPETPNFFVHHTFRIANHFQSQFLEA
jgi:hypothetical protein